jgi:hypothetical protein
MSCSFILTDPNKKVWTHNPLYEAYSASRAVAATNRKWRLGACIPRGVNAEAIEKQ